MFLTEHATEDLHSATLEGLHMLERAMAALWGSVGNMPRLVILSDTHAHMVGIDAAHIDVRETLHEAVERVHKAVQAIDDIIAMADRFNQDEMRKQIEQEEYDRRHR